jgi:basic amino acid/polyamine antiporter, APA family
MSRGRLVVSSSKPFGHWSGAGLVVANMIGAGVFLSAGFMAQSLGPGLILLAWMVGALLALCGAIAYGALAAAVPESGGEYRYLATYMHPLLGSAAGWASLLVGFSAPVAADALAIGAFANTLHIELSPGLIAVVVILALALAHASGFGSSVWTQNLLVAGKLLLVLGFVTLGIGRGAAAWPQWSPSAGTGTSGAFFGSLVFVMFAFSGWNAAIYAAGEFRDPRHDVPRAMLVGCSAVAVIYLLVNLVFVANLTPESARAVFAYESTRVTLGHVLARQLAGEVGGAVMSSLMIVVMLSAASAMTLAGPRVYAAMASDGFLPSGLTAREGRPPARAIFLQAGIATLLVLSHRLEHLLLNVGALLTLFTALTAFSVLRLPRPKGLRARLTLAAAWVYGVCATLLLCWACKESPSLLLWLVGLALAALVSRAASRRAGRQPGL